ncbi:MULTISPECIES: RDD family protein [Pseudomonas]|uniref:RDD family protein n=1 Tax=Pseudomonas TaxID=286 RepID=UPI001BE5198E|nr:MULTISPECIES: RDD family protein [Pseudomonas]MBT2340361.1 RDD family protein [Pseudomonas fluorescens]MCD4528583.1 RDD family protein [Pseudomonas sp. C3-2018]
MPKHLLIPQGDFPPVGLGRRLAAMFYDFLLCTALLIVTSGAYKMIQMAIIGEEKMHTLTEAGALDGDPLLSTVLLFVLFAFFAKFWTHNGQTLGMQVWGIRVQNADGTAISLWQALLRFVVSIASWLLVGLGFIWALFDKRKRSWHDIYSDTQLVRVPKKTK